MKKNSAGIPLEDKLLRDCAKIELDDATKNRLKEIPADKLNWQYILEKSKTEGITCLLYNNLLPFQDKIPQSTSKKLKEIYYAIMYSNIKTYEQIKPILSAFNRENLKVIPLKGVFLAEKVYKNIGLRAMNDIDLLVKKDELPKVDKLLEGLGYSTPIQKGLFFSAIDKSYLNSVDYYKTDERSLHVHWHLVNVSLPTYLYTKNIQMDKFWDSADDTQLAGIETLQLAPHHLIIYLAEHALKHSFNSLIFFSDIDAAIKIYAKQVNWQDLIKDTKTFGMERQVFYSLYFTDYFLETGIGDDILGQLKPKKNGFLEKRFFYAISNNKRNTKLGYFVYLGIVKSTINKLRFIIRTLFPPACVIALVFNLSKPKVTLKDYFKFLNKQLSHFKRTLNLLICSRR